MNRLAKNYALNTAYQLCTVIVPLITAPYLTRVLMATQYGIYSYVQSVAGIIQTLTLLGLYSYGNRQTAYCRDNPEELSQTFWELMTLRVILGAVGTAVYAVYVLSSQYRVYYLCYYAFFLSNILDCSWIYVGMENMAPCVIKNVVAKLATLFGVFLLVRTEDDTWKYTLLVALSSLVCNLLVYTQLKGIIRRPKVSRANAIKHLKGAFLLFLPQIASLLYLQMDKAMLGSMTGRTNEVSFYDQAEKLVTIAFSFITAVSTVMMPRIANEFKQGHDDRIAYYLNKVGTLSMAFAFPLMIGMMCIANDLVAWYLGAEYMPTASAIIAISSLAITNTLIGISGNQYFMATNKIKILTFSNTSAAVLNLIVNAILIPNHGYMGAAFATLLSSLLNVVIQYVYMNRFVKVKALMIASGKYLLLSLIMGASIILVTRAFALSATMRTTIIQLFTGVTVYALLLIIMKDPIVREVKVFIRRTVKKW